MVYEQVRADPQAAVDALWSRLGLVAGAADGRRPAVPVEQPAPSWTPPEGLVESLGVLYRPQVRRLERRLGPRPLAAWSTQP